MESIQPWSRARSIVSLALTVRTPYRERHLRPARPLPLDLRWSLISSGATPSSVDQYRHSSLRFWSAWYCTEYRTGLREYAVIQRAPSAITFGSELASATQLRLRL